MIVKANNNGIYIDVSANATLTEKFGTTHGIINKNAIIKFRINEHDGVSQVEVVDVERREYYVPHAYITQYNGSAPTFTTAVEFFNQLSSDVFGL